MKRLSLWMRYLLNMLIPVAGWVLALVLGPKLLRFFLPFVIGWILAMIANPLVRFLEKKLKIVRKHSSALIVVLVLAGLVGLIYWLVAALVVKGGDLIRSLPQMYELVRQDVLLTVGKMNHLFVRLPHGIQTYMNQFASNLGQYVSNLVQHIASPTVAVAGSVAKSIPGAFVGFIITVLSSYFFIAERDGIIKTLRPYTPKWVERYYGYLKTEVKHLIGGYFLAQFRIMFVVAVILAAGFLILRVRFGILFAVLIAFLDFLPMFGTGTALGPWAVVKLLSGEYAFAIGLILLYVLTQVVRQLIQPKIVGDVMGLPPLTTLFLLYVGFKLKGLAGMILAVPVGLFFMSLYRYGAFDNMKNNAVWLVQDINAFRRGDE